MRNVKRNVWSPCHLPLDFFELKITLKPVGLAQELRGEGNPPRLRSAPDGTMTARSGNSNVTRIQNRGELLRMPQHHVH